MVPESWGKPQPSSLKAPTPDPVYSQLFDLTLAGIKGNKKMNARQQKRHRCIEQCFGLCGRGQGWNDLNFFEFTKARFMAQDVIYPGEGSVSP